MKILISGAGIAGPTLAYWLLHYGFEPTLVEKSPHLRTGGYIVDFWGVGFDIAEKMGLLPQLLEQGYKVKVVRMVNERGKRVGGFPVHVIDKMTRGRFVSIPRGELAASIYRKIDGRFETLFGDEIREIIQTPSGVQVNFLRGKTRQFDLVIGADGLHSKVRELAFGDQTRFEKYLGYKVAAFETTGYDGRDEDTYLMYTQVGKQISRFTMRNDRTMFLFIFADSGTGSAFDLKTQKRIIRERFDDSGWEAGAVLKELEATNELYFDRVSQIRLENFFRDRVALVGDAAYCISLLGGQGSALAMIGAYVLAGELHKSKGNYTEAFRNYQKILGPFVRKKQEAAIRFGGAFAPKTTFGLFFRNQMSKLISVPLLAGLVIGRDIRDEIDLPTY